MHKLHSYCIAAIAIFGCATPVYSANATSQIQASQSSKNVAAGTILNIKDEPIAGAIIRVDNNRSVRTDAEGAFLIRNVRIGTKLSISATGYESVTYEWQGTPFKLILHRQGENPDKIIRQVLTIDDDIEEEQLISPEELQATETAFGSTTFDQGTDDVTVVRQHHDEVIIEEKKPVKADNDKIFYTAEEAPSFPGGSQAMYAYMKKNLRYPEMAAQDNIQGRVIVQFVVEKDGSIGEVKVVRGRDKSLDDEAVRLVKSMPKFIPGRMNGIAVRTWFTLPVNFNLSQN